MKNSGKPKRGEYIGNIIANLIFLWILSMVPGWDLDFLKDNYMMVLLILKINCIVQIAGNFILLFLPSRLLNLLLRIVLELVGVVPLIMMIYIYPFDFTGKWNWLDKALPVLFIIGLAIAAIKVITLTIKMFTGIKQECETPV